MDFLKGILIATGWMITLVSVVLLLISTPHTALCIRLFPNLTAIMTAGLLLIPNLPKPVFREETTNNIFYSTVSVFLIVIAVVLMPSNFTDIFTMPSFDPPPEEIQQADSSKKEDIPNYLNKPKLHSSIAPKYQYITYNTSCKVTKIVNANTILCEGKRNYTITLEGVTANGVTDKQKIDFLKKTVLGKTVDAKFNAINQSTGKGITPASNNKKIVYTEEQVDAMITSGRSELIEKPQEEPVVASAIVASTPKPKSKNNQPPTDKTNDNPIQNSTIIYLDFKNINQQINEKF